LEATAVRDNNYHLKAPAAGHDANETFGKNRDEISFVDDSKFYCISFVDIVDSTNIIFEISSKEKTRAYYTIFLNSISTIARNFGAKMIKNIGDSLLFYFPQTSDIGNRDAFKNVLDCSNALVDARNFVNKKLSLQSLPTISYRISADYGRVEVATTVTSGAEDLFGPTVNMCAKINSQAEPNGIVIGGDLHEIMKRFSFKEYLFHKVGKNQHIGIRYSYPVYAVARKDEVPARDSALNVFKKETSKPRLEKGTLSIYPQKPLQLSNDLASRPHPQQTSQLTVMLVDDEPDILAIFKYYLTSEGYNVEAFSDSYMALQSFARSPPHHYDLLVLDIRMPTINGLQLYQRLKAVDPYVKVIFLSALEATDELVRILDGVNTADVIRKPIDRKHFLQKVKATAESSHSRESN